MDFQNIDQVDMISCRQSILPLKNALESAENFTIPIRFRGATQGLLVGKFQVVFSEEHKTSGERSKPFPIRKSLDPNPVTASQQHSHSQPQNSNEVELP